MRQFALILLTLAVAALSGCDLSPEPVSLSDPKIAPMLKAIAAVDRSSMGFTPIPTNARIRLEMRPRAGYDAMLHIYAATQRTIAFRKTPDGYKWIAEQEIHYGPKMFTTGDGDFQEHVVVEYQLEPVNGIPTNQIHISYWGEDARLAGRDDLTLETIKPILEEWKGTRIR